MLPEVAAGPHQPPVAPQLQVGLSPSRGEATPIPAELENGGARPRLAAYTCIPSS